MIEVFGCSIVTDFLSGMFGFSVVFVSWVIIVVCFIGFNNLKAAFECSTVTDFIWLTVVRLCFFYKSNLWYSLALLGSGIFYELRNKSF